MAPAKHTKRKDFNPEEYIPQEGEIIDDELEDDFFEEEEEDFEEDSDYEDEGSDLADRIKEEYKRAKENKAKTEKAEGEGNPAGEGGEATGEAGAEGAAETGAEGAAEAGLEGTAEAGAETAVETGVEATAEVVVEGATEGAVAEAAGGTGCIAWLAGVLGLEATPVGWVLTAIAVVVLVLFLAIGLVIFLAGIATALPALLGGAGTPTTTTTPGGSCTIGSMTPGAKTPVEIAITTYQPCLDTSKRGDLKWCPDATGGGSTLANGGKIRIDDSSPSGYAVTHNGKTYNYVMAVSRDPNPPISPFWKSGQTPTEGLSFGDSGTIFVGFDHFGSSSHPSNHVDIMWRKDKIDELKNLERGFVTTRKLNHPLGSWRIFKMNKTQIASFTCTPTPGTTPGVPPPTGSIAAKVVQIARGELGKGDARGNNCGGDTAKYQRYAGCLGCGDSYPWCAAFVSWVFHEASGSNKIRTCGSYLALHSFPHVYSIRSQIPKPGDVVWRSRGGGKGHIGIVEKVSGTTLWTIEGNASSVVIRKSYANYGRNNWLNIGRW